MPHSYRFGNVEVLPVERQLLVGGRPEPVGSRAFDLLLVLIEGRSRLVTKDQLLDAVWPGLVVAENNLQAQVSALRKVIGAESIKTVSGLGYRFAATLAGDEEPIPPNGKSHGIDALGAALAVDEATLRQIDPLAVFIGAFRADAAERVLRECGADWPAGHSPSPLDLPQIERVPSVPSRLRLPQELRLHAQDRLRASGRMDAASRAHARTMGEIARAAIHAYWNSTGPGWRAAHRWDYDDLDAALAWACEKHDAAVGSLAGKVLNLLDLDRDSSRVKVRKEALFGLLGYATEEETRCLLLESLAMFRAVHIPQMRQLDAAMERESLCRKMGEPRAHYHALSRLANLHATEGNRKAMDSALRSARSLLDPRWPPRVRWVAAFNQVDGYLQLADGLAALEAVEGMGRISTELQDPTAVALSEYYKACAVVLTGNLAEAIPMVAASIPRLQDEGLWRLVGVCHCLLCGAYLYSDDLPAARATARRTLELNSSTDSYRLLDLLALLSVRMGRLHEAALLLGYGDALRTWRARPGPDLGPRATWEAANAIQAGLGARAHGRLRRMGAEMSDEQIRAIANEAIAAGAGS